MIQYEIKNPLNAEINEIFINKNTNILSYKNELGIVFTLLREGDVNPNIGNQTLQQVSDTGGLDNGSTIRQGSVDRFGLNGIETVCSNEKKIQWVDGREYYYENSIVHCNSINNDIPDDSYFQEGFIVGSRYTVLNTGKSYVAVLDGNLSIWLPMAGEYIPTLANDGVIVSNAALVSAFYVINEGWVDVTIRGDVDLDFSSGSQGLLTFTLPIPSISTEVLGSLSITAANQFNGIVRGDALFLSNDTSFIQGVRFVATFKYQAY